MEVLEARLVEPGTGWDAATAITVYGVACDLDRETLDRFGAGAVRGLRWYPSLPPIVDVGYEIDAHSVGSELTL